MLHHKIGVLFQNFYSYILHYPNFFIFPILQVKVNVLVVVNDVIIINFILNEYDDVTSVLIHALLKCAPLPFSMIAIENDPFSLLLVF